MYDVAKIEKLLIIVLLVQKTEKSRQNIGIIMAGIEEYEMLTIGMKVWAQWFQDIFYKGEVNEINKELQTIKVLFEDGGEKYFESDFLQVVIDKEININEWQTLKIGDVMLTKIRNSTAMAKGILENVGKLFFTLRLSDNTIVRRRSSSLRMFRPFKVAVLSTTPSITSSNTSLCDLFNSDFLIGVKVEQKLQDSVVVVKTVPPKLTNSDPFGSITPGENVDTLPSPEVLWGRKDLMDFSETSKDLMDFSESPVVSSGNNSEITIGLSLDPLNCQCLIPIDSSTPWQNEHAESSLHDSSLTVEF